MNELTLESWLITPECRSNRGQNGAWTEAVEQLRQVYLGQSNHDPGVVLRLSISRVRVDAVEAGAPLLPETVERTGSE